MKKLLLLWIMFFSAALCFSQENMEVEGAIIVKDSEATTPAPGTIRFNPTTNDFEGWNGLFWASLTGNQYEIGEMIDQDGNTYPTVIIGTQEWTATNLRTTTYRNGNKIVLIANDAAGNSAWRTANYGAYAVYDTIGTGYPFDLEKFGYLYNWYAVNDGRGLCPTGWHEPTDSEWTTLTDFLGDLPIAGGPMKKAGTTHWRSPNTGATNESGFTGLPGGNRSVDIGSSFVIGIFGYWWSSTESSSNKAWYRFLNYSIDDVSRNDFAKGLGFSVRCIRD